MSRIWVSAAAVAAARALPRDESESVSRAASSFHDVVEEAVAQALAGNSRDRVRARVAVLQPADVRVVRLYQVVDFVLALATPFAVTTVVNRWPVACSRATGTRPARTYQFAPDTSRAIMFCGNIALRRNA